MFIRKIATPFLAATLSFMMVAPALADDLPVEDNTESSEMSSEVSPLSDEEMLVGTPSPIPDPSFDEEEEVKERLEEVPIDGILINDADGMHFVDIEEEDEYGIAMLASVSSHRADMERRIRALGMPASEAKVVTANVVCGRTDAVGCASSGNPSTIAFGELR